jgi:hypothetical protein
MNRKSLPPIAPPEPITHARRRTLPFGMSGEFLVVGAAFLILMLG